MATTSVIPSSNSPDSPSGTNIDFFRLLLGSGNETRIVTGDGVPLSVETFLQNVNRYGNTFNNRFFVLIDGPGFVESPSAMREAFDRFFQPVSDIIAGADALVGGSNLNVGDVAGVQLNQSALDPVTQSVFDAYERLSILCSSASFPKADITSKKLEIIPGMQENVAQYRDFSGNSTFTLKFYNSSSMFERNYFESWMNTVVNIKNGIANYYDEYAKPFSISVLKLPRNAPGPSIINNLYGEQKVSVINGAGGADMSGFVYGVKYMECYPISINVVDFSYAKDATLTETEVTFAYKYYLSPSNISFLNSNINPGSNYGEYLNVLRNLINNKGKVSYDPQTNNTDRLANSINGFVNRVTNVTAAIQQIY